MKLPTFLFINFVVAFISDIILNDLSTNYSDTHMIGSLRSYFENKYITTAGVYAGITIILAVLLVSILTKFFIGFYVPKTIHELFTYVAIAYIAGYLIDVVIERIGVFGESLHQFYRITGSGHSGALAFIFSIVLSYILQKHLLPLL